MQTISNQIKTKYLPYLASKNVSILGNFPMVDGIKLIIKENALNTININIYGYRAYDNSRLLLDTFTFDIGHISNDRLKEQNDFDYELYDIVNSLEQHFRDIILLILTCKSLISNAIAIQLKADIGPSTSKGYVQEEVCKINLTDVKSFSITTLIQNFTKKILQKNIEFPWVSADNDIDITHCKKRLLDDTSLTKMKKSCLRLLQENLGKPQIHKV
ncbi:unnamed protein product [Gordionus sp. m RMFG-2023]